MGIAMFLNTAAVIIGFAQLGSFLDTKGLDDSCLILALGT